MKLLSISLAGIGNITVSAEFNFHCDPEAAFIVLENTQCPTYIASWELCLHRAKIDWVGNFHRPKLIQTNSDYFEIVCRIGGSMFTAESTLLRVD